MASGSAIGPWAVLRFNLKTVVINLKGELPPVGWFSPAMLVADRGEAGI